MIKAKLQDGTIILGLDRENLNRLSDDKPIIVKKDDLNISGDIYIVFGETLTDICKEYNLPVVQ